MMTPGQEAPADNGKEVYYLPADICGDHKPEVGKVISVKIVSPPDEDGHIGVEKVTGDSEEVSEGEMDKMGKSAFGEGDSDY